ncbi:MAG: Phosphoribosyltransferase [candidate division CPR2 bacterium GW2011_GWC1_39_9]|uniref:Phosphoribosyltransferase n=1 Tax=candidate division CPR2 bacterium GW2011_GWC2_39_10 TaxID=1618345 RepID=A0A0G0LST4_UNCC2|nr:MAG: Phosphoribosyltransferase [candidate division CPR2 bacterium GW2011_GWC2_39_10]KKR34844.1 MAG: Phosphoribosyltransferase [candidate division CPR2 bacterium GW2011_GWC1_39_9]
MKFEGKKQENKYYLGYKIWPLLKDFLYPKRCVSCGKIDTFLCEKCEKEIILVSDKKCLFCGRIMDKRVCDKCRKEFRVKNGVAYCYYREGPVKNIVWNLKFRGKKELAQVMAEKIKLLPNLENFVLVPVPLDKKRFRERGYNQSFLIAKHLAFESNLKTKDCLRKESRKPQMDLKKKDRQKNLEGAYTVIGEVPKKVILVDDVLTTGSTIKECVKVLKKAGAREVVVAVFARD